jgi:hypothetical protein
LREGMEQATAKTECGGLSTAPLTIRP